MNKILFAALVGALVLTGCHTGHAAPAPNKSTVYCDNMKDITLSLMSSNATIVLTTDDVHRSVSYTFWMDDHARYMYIVTRNNDEPGFRACVSKSQLSSINKAFLLEAISEIQTKN